MRLNCLTFLLLFVSTVKSIDYNNTNLTIATFKPLLDYKVSRTLTLKTVTGFNFASRLTLGNVFYFLLIHFERFGGDPKKRSIKNQILAQICTWILVIPLFAKPLYVWSVFISPLSPPLAKIYEILQNFTGIIVLSGLTEIVLLKSLMLFKFTTSTMIDEGFFSTLILSWNIGFASLESQFHLMMNRFSLESFLTEDPTKPNSTSKFWNTFPVICCCIMILGTATNSWKKYIERKKDEEILSQYGNFNTTPLNKPIVSTKTIATIVAMFSIITCIVTILITEEEVVEYVTYTHATYEFLTVFIMPIWTLATHGQLRNYIKTLFR